MVTFEEYAATSTTYKVFKFYSQICGGWVWLTATLESNGLYKLVIPTYYPRLHESGHT